MKAQHTFVTGTSGGGKTTYLRELHAHYDGASIFVTTKNTERKAVRDPPMRIVKSGASYPRDLEKAREWAYSRSENVQIIVDEAHETQVAQSKGPLKNGLHRDRDQGIKWVPCTQAPQDMKESRGYPALDQCPHFVWVGKTRMSQKGFIEYYGLQEVVPDERFKVHVIEPSIPPKLLKERYTKERFA